MRECHALKRRAGAFIDRHIPSPLKSRGLLPGYYFSLSYHFNILLNVQNESGRLHGKSYNSFIFSLLSLND